MKNNKDFVLYAKASVFPVGHENHGKRLLMERGSVAFLEAKCAMARIKPSKVGIVSAWFWQNVLKEELTIPHKGLKK